MNGQGRPSTPSLANVFRFTYRDQEVSYTESNIAGQPLVTVGERQFMGDQVLIEETRLGTLVTVELELVLDGDSTLLSLLLPPVRLVGWEQVDVKALAIRTTVRDTIAGPPLGPGVLYEAEEIAGTAAYIVS